MATLPGAQKVQDSLPALVALTKCEDKVIISLCTRSRKTCKDDTVGGSWDTIWSQRQIQLAMEQVAESCRETADSRGDLCTRKNKNNESKMSAHCSQVQGVDIC